MRLSKREMIAFGAGVVGGFFSPDVWLGVTTTLKSMVSVVAA